MVRLSARFASSTGLAAVVAWVAVVRDAGAEGVGAGCCTSHEGESGDGDASINTCLSTSFANMRGLAARSAGLAGGGHWISNGSRCLLKGTRCPVSIDRTTARGAPCLLQTCAAHCTFPAGDVAGMAIGVRRWCSVMAKPGRVRGRLLLLLLLRFQSCGHRRYQHQNQCWHPSLHAAQHRQHCGRHGTDAALDQSRRRSSARLPS